MHLHCTVHMSPYAGMAAAVHMYKVGSVCAAEEQLPSVSHQTRILKQQEQLVLLVQSRLWSFVMQCLECHDVSSRTTRPAL